jgi:hypothetical protein
MKKNITLIMLLTLCTSLMAQVKVNKEPFQAVPVNMEQNRYYTGFDPNANLIPNPSPNKMIPSDHFYTQIGETLYETPTNNNSRNTIGFRPKYTEGASVWTMMGYNNQTRGTGINYYNINENSWNPIPNSETERIETVRTGWGTHGFTHEGEIVVAHDGETGLIVNTRDLSGQGNWQQSTLTGPQYLLYNIPTTAILWPTMAINGNTVHVVCVTDIWTSEYPTNYEPTPDVYPYGYLGFSALPLYYRSTDGGKTWDIKAHDFRAEGMTNFECFRTTADGYVLAARGNHVVLLYNDRMGFVNYMESKDGGDTWVKKTVYDFGLEFDQSPNAEPRLMPTTSSVFIDETHKVHVVFGTQCHCKSENEIFFYPDTPIGMIYWNDDQESINWQNIRGWRDGSGSLIDWNWEEYPGYITLPSVVGLDKYYLWEESPTYDMDHFRNFGWTILPRILAKDGRVYVSYQSPLDYPFIGGIDNNYYYRGIFITVSEDDGETWDVQNNTSWISYHPLFMYADWSNYIYPTYNPQGEPIYHPNSITIQFKSENAYPSMSYNYKGNLFMLQWYNRYTPFSIYGADLDVFTFTQDLKNIPAYKNIQEIYKGLWNGNDPIIEFPPDACEKPLEFEGSCEENDVFLTWEEPDYMPVPLLGYNIFRDGTKLNTSPISETNFTDAGIDFGIYHYQVSAIYQNCESNLTHPVIIITLLCETPVELAGTVYENHATISWNEPENINGVLQGYNIYRDGNKINESLITDNNYTDENLTIGTTYFYQVSAVYDHCESELTGEFSIFVPQFCEKPLNLSVTVENGTVSLTWNKPEKIDGVLSGYNIYRNEAMINETPIIVEEYKDEDLENGDYLYQISAVYAHCESELIDGETITIIGIHGFETAVFDIYPNPTTGNVTFEGAGLNRIEIFEAQGRKLAEYNIINGILQINVSQYQNGIYFVKMYAEDNQMVTKRLVILR